MLLNMEPVNLFIVYSWQKNITGIQWWVPCEALSLTACCASVGADRVCCWSCWCWMESKRLVRLLNVVGQLQQFLYVLLKDLPFWSLRLSTLLTWHVEHLQIIWVTFELRTVTESFHCYALAIVCQFNHDEIIREKQRIKFQINEVRCIGYVCDNMIYLIYHTNVS